MLRLFRRLTPRVDVRTVKIYSVWSTDDSKVIDRPALVDGLLATSEKFFGHVPQQYVIHGPYGISKGRAVGIKAFRSKLAKRGHYDYYGIDGYGTGSVFGFNYLADARTEGDHRYALLLLWYLIDKQVVDPLDLARSVLGYFPADYGYVADFPTGYGVLAESRPKKTFFGTEFAEDPDHAKWRLSMIPGVLTGEIRALYRYNFLNERQAETLKRIGLPPPIDLANGISALVLTDDATFHESRRRYDAVVRRVPHLGRVT